MSFCLGLSLLQKYVLPCLFKQQLLAVQNIAKLMHYECVEYSDIEARNENISELVSYCRAKAKDEKFLLISEFCLHTSNNLQ